MRFSHLSQAFFPISAVLLSLVFLAGCSLLIPENESAVRYNKVIGQRHAPALNPSSAQGTAPDQTPGDGSSAAPASAPQSTAAAYAPPPGQEMQPASEPAMAAPPPHRSFWSRMEFWKSDDTPTVGDANHMPVPPASMPMAAAPAGAMRQVPQENTQVAVSGYPSLDSVPPRPPADDAGRLQQVRQQLEQDKLNSTNASSRLSSDAAAEPMLSPMPEGTAPAPLPVSSQPLPPPGQSAPAPQSYNYMNLPPPPPPLASNVASSYPPLQQPAPMPAYTPPPAPQTVAYAPSAAPAMEPIILHPPGTTVALPPAGNQGYQPVPAPQATPPAAPGGFDPMAGAATPYYNNGQQVAGATGYLPDSRYSSRRTE